VYNVSMNPLKGQSLKSKERIKERTVTVRLTHMQFDSLHKLAEEEERSLSFLVRKAVEMYLSSKR